MAGLPDGTITLLFADVEGSTRHLLRLGDRYTSVLERQNAVVTGAVERYHGHLVDTQGDTSLAAFATAQDAIQAAIEAQRALAAEPWPGGEPLRVRFGLHTGEPVRNAAGYAGLDVHRAARICTAAHGGQILISQTTRDLIAHAVPADAVLVDLGHHMLKDLPQPEHLIQVAGPGMEREFPPPRTLGAPAGLPPHRQTLIGRESQLEACRELLLRDDDPPALADRAGRDGQDVAGGPPGRLADAGLRGRRLLRRPRVDRRAGAGAARRGAGARRPGAGRPAAAGRPGGRARGAATACWCWTTSSTCCRPPRSWRTWCGPVRS